MVNNIILGPIIGAVTNEYAKIWFFGEWASGQKPECAVFIKGSNRHIKGAPFKFKELHSDLHDFNNFKGKSYLARIIFPPGRDKNYVFKINTEDSPEKTFDLKRAPKDEDIDFSFGLISCHNALKNVFRDDIAKEMWKYMYDKLSEFGSSFLIQCGDQVYCDEETDAWNKSLDAQNNREKLKYYRDTYLQSWGFNEVQMVMSSFPQLMIWDDHEVTNGWGSEIEHNADPFCQDVFNVAKQVYYEFQHSHNPDPVKKDRFYYGYYYGNAAFLFLDLRGERITTERKIHHFKRIYQKTEAIVLKGQILSEEQWSEVEKWLTSPKTMKSKVLFVVSSVPVIHLNRELGSFGWFKNDIMDQWSVDEHKKERRKLLKNLFNWMGEKNKPVIILSGDVHVGTEASIIAKMNGGEKLIFQYTSSPITNTPAALLDVILGFFSKKITFHLDRTNLITVNAEILKRHRKRNFGVIKVKYKNGIPEIEFYMNRRGEKEPVRRSLVYDREKKQYVIVKLL